MPGFEIFYLYLNESVVQENEFEGLDISYDFWHGHSCRRGKRIPKNKVIIPSGQVDRFRALVFHNHPLRALDLRP